jgi:hypothetical protein
MTTIFSQIIGSLRQDEQLDDWWVSEGVAVPFFGGKVLPVIFMGYRPGEDAAFIEDADRTLRNFLKLSQTNRQNVSEHVHRNCTDFLDAVELDEADERLREITRPEEIWAFVHPQTVYVKRRHRRDREIYLTVACECDWEEEHGLQLVFRQGRQLTRVSGQDGHLTHADAYNVPDSEDALLSSFKP